MIAGAGVDERGRTEIAGRPARAAGLAALALAMLAAVVVGAALGAVPFAPAVVFGALAHPHAQDDAARVLWSLRFPRVLLGVLVGATLAVAGTLLQGMLRNPLVDPYLTGSSAGAACAIAFAIALGVAAPLYPLLAFVASLATAVLVAGLARTGAGIAPERLILAGISLSAMFAGIVTLVIMLSPTAAASLSILAWLGGSLAGRGWTDLAWTLPYVAAGAAASLALAPVLNTLRLGERRARALGVDVDRAQWSIVGAASLLTAAAVSVSGLVGFVGLIIPHVARKAVGTDARWLIPAAAFAGATAVVLADTLARTVAPPLELPLGVLLSLLGVPAFIYLAFRKRAA